MTNSGACFVAIIIAILFVLMEVIMSSNKSKANNNSKLKRQARYPQVSSSLYKEPLSEDSFCLGLQNKKKVYLPFSDVTHMFIVAPSGAGKSVYLLSSFLNFKKHPITFCIDPKGEIYSKTCKFNPDEDFADKSVRHTYLIDPNNRMTQGYDPFYSLRDNPKSQDIYKCAIQIAECLIPDDKAKDPFWNNSARNLLTSSIIYYFKQGVDNFPDICMQICNKDATDLVNEICENSSETSAEYSLVKSMLKLPDQTLPGILQSLTIKLRIFCNDEDIKYCLRDNKIKANPSLLLSGDSIYLSVKEESLTDYANFIVLIMLQTLKILSTRNEYPVTEIDKEPILFLAEECARISSAVPGCLHMLGDASLIARSRRIKLSIVTQSYEALYSSLSKDEVTSLVSNCGTTVVLRSNVTSTSDDFIKKAGQYNEKKKSWSNENNAKKKSVSVNYDKENILDYQDLDSLVQQDDIIIFSEKHGYMRFKKFKYYEDSVLNKIAQDNISHNRKMHLINN